MSYTVDAEERALARQSAETVLSRRLGGLSALSAADLVVLRQLKGHTVAAGAIVHSGAIGSDRPGYFLSGWGARLATGASDTKQIVTLLLPGDGFGVSPSPWAGESLPVCTLTDSVLLDASAVRTLVRQRNSGHAGLIEACERAAWLEQAYALNHLIRLGQQSAYERVAHLVRELFVRLNDVGLADRNRFSMPLRQQIIADALGLSCVHFNRVARRMRKDGLIDFVRGAVHVLDTAALAAMTGGAWIG